jgi:pimeloyl-ACP methyl ester carboxylesterase
MGGMALERLALLAPQRLRKLVAVAPVPRLRRGLRCNGPRGAVSAADGVAARRAIIDRSTGGRLPASWLDWKALFVGQRGPGGVCRYFSRGAKRISAAKCGGRRRICPCWRWWASTIPVSTRPSCAAPIWRGTRRPGWKCWPMRDTTR